MALSDVVSRGFEVLHEVVEAMISNLLLFSFCCKLLLY